MKKGLFYTNSAIEASDCPNAAQTSAQMKVPPLLLNVQSSASGGTKTLCIILNTSQHSKYHYWMALQIRRQAAMQLSKLGGQSDFVHTTDLLTHQHALVETRVHSNDKGHPAVPCLHVPQVMMDSNLVREAIRADHARRPDWLQNQFNPLPLYSAAWSRRCCN